MRTEFTSPADELRHLQGLRASLEKTIATGALKNHPATESHVRDQLRSTIARQTVLERELAAAALAGAAP